MSAVEIKRDGYGRPLVVPPNGGKAVGYTRATTLAGTLDEMSKLMAWKQRLTAIGVTERTDLQVSVAAHRDDKDLLDHLCEQALAHAKGGAAATTGTALHTFTEKLDRGEPLGFVPAAFQADIEAYQKARVNFRPVHIERFVALDEHKVGGTPDRIDWYEGPGPDGKPFGGYLVTDLKSGGKYTTTYGALKIAIQLAIYANGVFYDPATAQREPLPEVSKQWGVVTHMPAGSGVCELHWIDLDAGWEAMHVALAVRKWRKRKKLTRPVQVTS